MPKINALPNGNNQLPNIIAKTVKINSQATPQNNAEKNLSERPPEPKDLPKEGQPANTEERSAEASAPIDPKFEALAKKESALRMREKEFQAKEASLEARVQEAVQKALGDYRSRVKESPLDILNEEGITYDQLVEAAVNAPDHATREIKNELKSLRDAQAKLAEDTKKAAESQRTAAVTQIKHDVTDLVNNDAQFETIKGTESVDDVVELITRTFDETGKLLSIEDAAKAVEEELFKEAIRIASLSKVKAHNTPTTTEAPKQPGQKQQQLQTLTNSMNKGGKMSAYDRAILAFKGQLKS